MRKRRLQDAFTPAPPGFEARIRYTAAHMEELTMRKRKRVRAVILIAALSLALAGGAFAAALRWGTRDFLAPEGEVPQGGSIEGLEELVTPIGQRHEGQGFTLLLQDALFDGAYLSAAWTVTNTSEEPLFYFTEPLAPPAGYTAEMRIFTSPGVRIAPGEARNFGTTYMLSPQVPAGESITVALPFTIARALQPVADFDLPDAIASEMTDAEWAAHNALLEEAARSGSLVVQNGAAQLPRAYRDGEGSDLAKYLAAGLMEPVEAFRLEVTVESVAEAVSALVGGQPIEVEGEGYTLRVTWAEATQNTTRIEMEYVFPDEAAMLRLAEAREDWLYVENRGLTVMLPGAECFLATLPEVTAFVRGGAEEPPGIQGFSASTWDIHEREDGAWVVPMRQEAMTYGARPEVITVVPTGFHWTMEDYQEIYYLEDAIELRFGE